MRFNAGIFAELQVLQPTPELVTTKLAARPTAFILRPKAATRHSRALPCQLSDGDAEHYFRVGLLQEKLRNWAAAEEAFAAAIKRNSATPEWHLRLGRAREKLKDWRAAAAAYEGAVALNQTQPEWHSLRSYVSAA